MVPSIQSNPQDMCQAEPGCSPAEALAQAAVWDSRCLRWGSAAPKFPPEPGGLYEAEPVGKTWSWPVLGLPVLSEPDVQEVSGVLSEKGKWIYGRDFSISANMGRSMVMLVHTSALENHYPEASIRCSNMPPDAVINYQDVRGAGCESPAQMPWAFTRHHQHCRCLDSEVRQWHMYMIAI